MQNRRSIATTAAVLALGAVLAGCTAAVEPAVSFAAEKLTIPNIPMMVSGQAISAVTLPPAMGGKDTLTYSLTPEVQGLTFDPATRVLSGTPTAAGTYPMTYTATDAESTMASVKFTITVNTAKPTLWGTWRSSSTYDWYGHSGDQVVGTFVDTLTFTDSRYILHRSHYYFDGTFDSSWTDSGTWEADTPGTVTRIWEDDDDDDGETPRRLRRLPKQYVWADEARNVLLMTHWPDDHEHTGLDRYERVVPDPLPADAIVGGWRGRTEWNHGPVAFIMTVNGDGTFIFELQWPDGTETTTAKWELDTGNYYLSLTDARETWTPTGGSPEPTGDFKGADRFALAPTDRSPAEIVVSGSWHETKAQDDYRKYGNYGMMLTRQ